MELIQRLTRPQIGDALNILILNFEPSNAQILEFTLELEGYTVMVTQSAAETLRIIESSSDVFVLLADNYHVNPEARQAFTMLHQRAEVRSRVTIIGLAALPAFESVAIHMKAVGLMDDHLCMPYTIEQLIRIVESHDKPASGSTR